MPQHNNKDGSSKKPAPRVYIWVFLLVAAIAAGIGWLFFASPWRAVPVQGSIPAPAPPTASPVAAPTPPPTPEPTPAPTPSPTPDPTPTPVPTPPPIPDDGSDGFMSSGLYIWNNKAFEIFYGSTETATAYAHAVSGYRNQLPGQTVYNMVVPNHSEFGLPIRIREGLGASSQRQNTQDVYSNYTADVKAVDIYDVLNLHNNEYLYFGTDTHWAPLGAYYAYTKFCEVAGIAAVPLDSMAKTTFDGFTGYLEYATGEPVLNENPDHIDVYDPTVAYTALLSYDGYSFNEMPGVNAHDAGMGYSMLAWGDNPCLKLMQTGGTTGRKLVLVKDSYGNALAPYLIESFDEVHVIDFRSFPQNLPAYCTENGITDVLFFNNVMSANTGSQIKTMDKLFG